GDRLRLVSQNPALYRRAIMIFDNTVFGSATKSEIRIHPVRTIGAINFHQIIGNGKERHGEPFGPDRRSLYFGFVIAGDEAAFAIQRAYMKRRKETLEELARFCRWEFFGDSGCSTV